MNYRITLEQTKGKKVYVNPGEREGIYLYPSEIRRCRLEEGASVTQEELEQMRLQYALPRAKRRAIAILARRDQTEYELRQKLEKSFTDSASLEETMDYVRTCGYVDDLQYSRDYMASKRHRKSFRMIMMELRKKGISDGVLALVFEEAGQDRDSDLAPLVEKYLRRFPEIDETALRKTEAHFYRKGYQAGLVRRVVRDRVREQGSIRPSLLH